MVMMAPVPMGVPVVAPRVVSPIIVSVRMVAVVPPTHHDHRRGSDHDGRRDAEADVDNNAGLSGLRLRKQGKSQKGDHTPHTYDRCETFHGHILPVEHQLCSITWRVIESMLPHLCRLAVHST